MGDTEPETDALQVVPPAGAAVSGEGEEEGADPAESGNRPRRTRPKKAPRGLQSDWATMKCHQKAHAVMFDPNSGAAAKVFTMLMSILVIVSIVFFTMSTMPEYADAPRPSTFDTADDIFYIIFTLEFIVRFALICVGRPAAELIDFFMVVDFLAILPAIIDICSGKLPFTVPLRLSLSPFLLCSLFCLSLSLSLCLLP